LAFCTLWFFGSLSLIPFVVVHVSQYLKLGKADDDEN
jgi:hypothetical protein